MDQRRHTEQCNKIESIVVDSDVRVQPIFTKEVQWKGLSVQHTVLEYLSIHVQKLTN